MSQPSNAVPEARVIPTSSRSWAWLLPVLALLLAIFLVRQSIHTGGTQIQLTAEQGHGIKVGDQVRFRGITVGVVRGVQLAPDLEGVVLELSIQPEAERLACNGTLFWIVHPELSLGNVTGLETLVGSRYIAVLPGPAGGERQTEFVAREERPLAEKVGHGGLEVILEAETTHGIVPGAAVTYRQIPIGTVLSVGLSSDATCVEIRTHIDPAYKGLVRSTSRFWESGGLELEIGLAKGLELDLMNLRSLIGGGVSMATPDDAEGLVATGARFELHSEPEEAWLRWSPPLPVGATLLPDQAPVPRPMWAQLNWREGRLLESDESMEGWLLALPGGVLGPLDLLQAPPEAKEGSPRLALGGGAFDLRRGLEWESGGIAFMAATVESGVEWDVERVRELGAEPEACLVFGDPGRPPVALSPARLTGTSRGWQVDPAIGLGPTWHGAAVLAREDGLLIGVLLTRSGGPRIVPARQD